MHYSEFRYDLLGIRISSALKGIIYLNVRRQIYSPCYFLHYISRIDQNHSRLKLWIIGNAVKMVVFNVFYVFRTLHYPASRGFLVTLSTSGPIKNLSENLYYFLCICAT